MTRQSSGHRGFQLRVLRHTLAAFVVASVVSPGVTIGDDAAPDTRAEPTHMSEARRASVKKLVVLPTETPPEGVVTGTYRKETLGVLDGMDDGRKYGDGISTDVGGIRVNYPIPVLTIPGMLLGGLTGGTRRAIQDFRDELTADLAEAAGRTLTNDALASDVFWGLRNVTSLDPKIYALTTPIPEDVDAVLFVSMTGIQIEVQDKEAIITTTGNGTLRRLSDGRDIYTANVFYEDRDKLVDWTRNGNAAWHSYAQFARHYIGREISGQIAERIDIERELKPVESENVDRVRKNDWQSVTKTTTPTLAWRHSLLGGGSSGIEVDGIGAADIFYDIEVYDLQQPVYSAKNLTEPRHTLSVELDCKTYRWSVRPAYRIDGVVKYGDWMRFETAAGGNGNVGTKASGVPAYIRDFASLEIKCRRR